MVNGCQNSGPYNQARSQTHCALLTPAFSDPHQAGADATVAGGHQIMKHLRLAGGRRRKRKTESMRGWRRSWRQMGGDVICPAAVPVGSSSWPTFPNQNGPFSTAQNANTASQTNNALSASTKAQAMYDHEASNIPSGLEGTPQSGGSYGELTRSGMKAAFRRAKADRPRRLNLIRRRRAKGLTRSGKPRRGAQRYKRPTRRKTTRRKTTRRKTTRRKTTRRHRGGHQDRWKTWGCSSGGGGHLGRLWTVFSGRRDMLRHKIPYP